MNEDKEEQAMRRTRLTDDERLEWEYLQHRVAARSIWRME